MSTLPDPLSDLDKHIRRFVYDAFITQSRAILKGEIASVLSLPEKDVAASSRRLAEAHMLVLQPASGEILMANPFSAVPTAFQVSSGSRRWWGNCIWDALGVIAMTGGEGRVETSCPDCGEALAMTVKDNRLAEAEGIAHFAVPARRWWDDIVFS